MMATTHAFVGLAMAVPVAMLAPEVAVPAAVGGLAGGAFPDLDMVAEHRKTLHFPVLYWVPAVPAALVAAVWPTPATVGVALFLLAAAVHSGSDVFGGGLELRPWRGTSNRGVYVRATNTWLPPLRLVRYDGSPEDLALAVAFAIPGLAAFDGTVRLVGFLALVVSAVYTLLRKRIVDWAPERFH